MNADILRQIVEEFKEMPDESLNFSTFWCDKDGVITMCPIGYHITCHPELVDLLNVKSQATLYKGHHSKKWDISSFELCRYLDISEAAVDMLFIDSCLTRDTFVKLVDQFVQGEIDIRECQVDHCCRTYITDPTDTGCVCDYCRGELLGMLGM